ncbi:hypothetical protein [Massilibacteroides sp.]|uniref:hypothetical protein n=1 Tax=Massilibacteroides sp. TaxID=2034766 RepID=UPI002628AB52|nr:hypothetical protein [Massilibacteroides sp.]MDD4516346.1 hypothetical protein [Massilibacteroides sp.]
MKLFYIDSRSNKTLLKEVKDNEDTRSTILDHRKKLFFNSSKWFNIIEGKDKDFFIHQDKEIKIENAEYVLEY